MAGSLGRTDCCRSTCTAPGFCCRLVFKALAAMLSQEADDGIDAMVLGATDHFASNLFLCDEARTNQPAQMKRQGGCRQVKASLYFADVQSTRTGANQKPVDVEAGQVAQFGEAACGEF